VTVHSTLPSVKELGTVMMLSISPKKLCNTMIPTMTDKSILVITLLMIT
jgi:hypothetical protein